MISKISGKHDDMMKIKTIKTMLRKAIIKNCSFSRHKKSEGNRNIISKELF